MATHDVIVKDYFLYCSLSLTHLPEVDVPGRSSLLVRHWADGGVSNFASHHLGIGDSSVKQVPIHWAYAGAKTNHILLLCQAKQFCEGDV